MDGYAVGERRTTLWDARCDLHFQSVTGWRRQDAAPCNQAQVLGTRHTRVGRYSPSKKKRPRRMISHAKGRLGLSMNLCPPWATVMIVRTDYAIVN